MFNADTKYALRAMTELARSTGPATIHELAVQTVAPAPTLAKVLNRLMQHRIVVGRPGRNGGYRLARPADQIRLQDIVRATEGPEFGRFCLFGLPDCSDAHPCPLHPLWGAIRESLERALDRHTIADLAGGRVDYPDLADHIRRLGAPP